MKIFVLSGVNLGFGTDVDYGPTIPTDKKYDLLIAPRRDAGALEDQPIERHFKYCVLVADYTYSIRIYEQQGPKKYAIHTEHVRNSGDRKMGFQSFVYGFLLGLQGISRDLLIALHTSGLWDDMQEIRKAARTGADFGMQRPDR